MKSINIFKKWIVGATLASSFLVLAHSVLDNAKFYDLNFISEDEVVFESNINDKRIIASKKETLKAPKVSKISVLEASNIEKNEWEIVRITNTLGNVFYDKNIGGDSNSKIIVKLKTINPFKIRLNNDKSLDYFVSIYKHSTIALFHKVNDSYEILELKRKKKLVLAKKVNKIKSKKIAKAKKAKGMIFNNEGELLAYSAVDPSRNRRALLASQVSGSVEVVDGEITVSDLVLHKGTNNETEAVSFGARVLDGGVIRYNDNSTGKIGNAILMNNGENGFTLRFTSGGPLSGALVNFFTPEEIDKKNRVTDLQRERTIENNQDILRTQEVDNSQRRIASNQDQNNEDLSEQNFDEESNDENFIEEDQALKKSQIEEDNGGFEF